jgi:hypothetical protein
VDAMNKVIIIFVVVLGKRGPTEDSTTNKEKCDG